MINYIRCRVAPRSTPRANATLRRHPCEIIEWQGWESEEYRAKRVSLSTRSVTHWRIYRVLLKRLHKLRERIACSETKKESYQYTGDRHLFVHDSITHRYIHSTFIWSKMKIPCCLLKSWQPYLLHIDFNKKKLFYLLFKKLIFLIYTNILATPYITVISNTYKGA